MASLWKLITEREHMQVESEEDKQPQHNEENMVH